MYFIKKIEIPNVAVSIADGAFVYCKSLTNIHIPESVTSIEDGAFQHCKRLTSIYIPASVTSIGIWAFYDGEGNYYCDNLVIYTTKGSYAEEYAKENNIPVEYIK